MLYMYTLSFFFFLLCLLCTSSVALPGVMYSGYDVYSHAMVILAFAIFLSYSLHERIKQNV